MVLKIVEKNCISLILLRDQHHHRIQNCNVMHEFYLALPCSSTFLQQQREHTWRIASKHGSKR